MREIKAQFLRGANISKNIQEKLRPYNDLFEMVIACKSLLSRRTYDESHGKPSKTKYQNKKYRDGSLVVPLMDIKFSFKTKFMQKTEGMRFEQIMVGSYPISV